MQSLQNSLADCHRIGFMSGSSLKRGFNKRRRRRAADTSDTAALKVPASLAGKDKDGILDGMKKGGAVNEGVEENGVGCDDRKRWRGIW